MSDAPLLESVDARGVATLTLNRPDKGNAYNQTLLEALDAALVRLSADAAVRAIVLRGNGRHFCAGADIGAHDPDAAPPRVTLPGFCRALDECAKPVIARIHGGCIGGGLAFVACCDVAVAARDAFFSLPEVRLGFAPLPLTPFLVRAMPPRALRRYLVSGERFAAEEALRVGLVHEVADAAALDDAVAKAVASLLEAGPGAAAAAKLALRRQTGGAITEALLAELQDEFRHGADSAEANEGRAAFREKRKPGWAPKA